MRTYVLSLIALALASPANAQGLPSGFDPNLFAIALCGPESEERCYQTELGLEQYDMGKYYYTASARSGGVEFWYKFIVYPSIDGRLPDGYYQQHVWGDPPGDGPPDIYLEFRSEHGSVQEFGIFRPAVEGERAVVSDWATATVTHREPTTTTPEPATLVLMGSGLAGLAAVRRRRTRERH